MYKQVEKCTLKIFKYGQKFRNKYSERCIYKQNTKHLGTYLFFTRYIKC